MAVQKAFIQRQVDCHYCLVPGIPDARIILLSEAWHCQTFVILDPFITPSESVQPTIQTFIAFYI